MVGMFIQISFSTDLSSSRSPGRGGAMTLTMWMRSWDTRSGRLRHWRRKSRSRRHQNSCSFSPSRPLMSWAKDITCYASTISSSLQFFMMGVLCYVCFCEWEFYRHISLEIMLNIKGLLKMTFKIPWWILFFASSVLWDALIGKVALQTDL